MEEFKRLLTECLFVLNQVSNQPYYYLNEDRRTYSLASKIETAIKQSDSGIEYKCPECDFVFGGHNSYYRACSCDHRETTEEGNTEKAKALWALFGDITIDDKECIESPFDGFPIGTDRFEIFHWFEETFNLSVAKDLMKIE